MPIDVNFLNSLNRTFQAPDPRELDQQNYQNALLKNAVQTAPLRNQALQLQNQQEGVKTQAMQGQLGAGIRSQAAQIYAGIATADDPIGAARTAMSNPQLAQIVQQAGVPFHPQGLTPQDTPQSIGKEAYTTARMLGVDPLAKARTIVPQGSDVLEGDRLVYRNPKELGASNSMTGSLQELAAINSDRKSKGLAPMPAEEYLRNRRGTSADMQAYNEYLSQLRPGTQPLSLSDYLASTAGNKAGAEKQAQTTQERFSKQIDEGYKAADSLPVLYRSLELLDTVKTGGLARAQLAFTNFLGITGADEGQLSANVGKAVLSQLRTTFGAQFTEAEGRRLAEIEAGFGKSTAVNRRLLDQARVLVERVANRGIYAAEQTNSKYDADQIRKAMGIRLNGERPQSAPTSSPEIENLLDKYAPRP